MDLCLLVCIIHTQTKQMANTDNTGLKHRDVSRLLAGEYKGMLNDEREQWVEKEKKGKVAIRS